MPWTPGQPVQTPQDREDWGAWKASRKREQQRARRARLRRVDYYPSPEAAAVIDGLTGPHRGGTYAEVIDALVLSAFRNLVGAKKGHRDCNGVRSPRNAGASVGSLLP